MSTGETVERMRDHWWWRPGWRVGRSFYTWHITFGNQPAVHQVADGYAPALDGVPTLDLIPPLWLHLTMQGVGFTDEVSRADADRIVGAVRAGCAVLAPFTVTLGPARVDAEALKLPVPPPNPLPGCAARFAAPSQRCGGMTTCRRAPTASARTSASPTQTPPDPAT